MLAALNQCTEWGGVNTRQGVPYSVNSRVSPLPPSLLTCRVACALDDNDSLLFAPVRKGVDRSSASSIHLHLPLEYDKIAPFSTSVFHAQPQREGTLPPSLVFRITCQDLYWHPPLLPLPPIGYWQPCLDVKTVLWPLIRSATATQDRLVSGLVVKE